MFFFLKDSIDDVYVRHDIGLSRRRRCSHRDRNHTAHNSRRDDIRHADQIRLYAELHASCRLPLLRSNWFRNRVHFRAK